MKPRTSSEVKSSLTGVKKVEQILADLNHLASTTTDSNRNPILAQKAIVESNFTLQTKLDSNIYQTKQMVQAIKDLEKSTKYTERVMIALTIGQILLAVVSIYIAIKSVSTLL